MSIALVTWFPGGGTAPRSIVGGKADSLIRMAASGLPVPPGAVLTTEFFLGWFEAIQASPPWTTLVQAAPDRWKEPCVELKRLSSSLPLSERQRWALEELRARLERPGGTPLLAVRSSSPEEDMESRSFAGLYETRLGVRPADLESAVRASFASSLDERVFAYKRASGLDPFSPKIAVIAQEQIASELAGVAFSINPVTNDYDEAVIDANWGLGESVVAGIASPDHFVVDKVARRVLERSLGSKRLSVWLDPEGGTVERSHDGSREVSLKGEKIDALMDLLSRAEALFETPIDMEWAYAHDRFYVLQARPITSYIPLPPEMLTKPGERRRLYADIALSGGMATNAPISPMGLDWMRRTVTCLSEIFLGPLDLRLTPAQRLWIFTGGRMYQDLSNVLWLASPKKLSKSVAASDALMAEIFEGIDADRYRSASRPPWAKLSMLRVLPRLLWRSRRVFGNLLWAMVAPERAYRRYRRQLEAYDVTGLEFFETARPLGERLTAAAQPHFRYLLEVTMSALGAGLLALGLVGTVVGGRSPGRKALVEKLKMGVTGNVVTEMGMALSRLARALDVSDFDDLDRLVARIQERRMPEAFLKEWDAFLACYGWRGPGEMDVANPRYEDDPALVLRQASSLANARHDPEAAHRRVVEERRRAYQTLRAQLGQPRRRLLDHLYRVSDCFAGTRDTPKHYNLLFFRAVRARLLEEGHRLVRDGRLDAAEDVFGLTFIDLERAEQDPFLDLRSVHETRTRFLKRLEARVRTFPPVIDSRGRILRPPPRAEKPGELRGMPISPGIASGPVTILRDPTEKPVHSGDVLVAYATDPGWTPLFSVAGAVVLEIGGVLQHGAVVAREFGKPCVAGIDRVTTRLRDGQLVEVDGTAGVVRLLAPGSGPRSQDASSEQSPISLSE